MLAHHRPNFQKVILNPPTTTTHIGIKTEGNGRKTLFLLPFLYFLVETGAGSENAGSKTESGYADIRKRTNTDGEPKN
jgi:hypothetical protein